MQLARIVIGVDLTKSSTEAALWAALRFAPEARVILLHCVSPLLPDERIAEEHARAEEYLGYLAKRIGVSRCTIAIRLGEPARTIAELAEEMDADLVAVGTHEDHPDREPSLGGTAERLVRCSAAPVLLCGEHRSRAPRSVLLPLDSADVSWSVAEWTGAIASRFDARVVLVHIEAPHGIGSTKRAFLHMQPREEATTPWTRVARELPAHRVFVDAVRGDTPEAVLAESRRFDTDLVLLSSAGGPVEEMLKNAECAVLVVPPSGRD